MIRKKLISKVFLLFLAAVIVSSSFQMTAYAEDTKDKVVVTLSMYSNKTNKTNISGYYQNNIFYVSIEDICKIADGKTKNSKDGHLMLLLQNEFRTFSVENSNGGKIEEIFNSGSYQLNVPVMKQENNIYISLIHFLNYIGASYKLDKNSNPQLMVAVRYNLFDAMQDVAEANNGNFFSWDEVDCEGMDLEDFLVNAGVVALINRDSNIFRMMLDAKGIEREAIEDALISIIKNEGNKYFDDSNSFLDFYNTATDAYSMTADFVKFIAKTYSTDATEEISELMGDYAEKSSDNLGNVAKALNALESYKQFDSISEAERLLLENTIIASPEDSDTLCNGWENVLKAAKNVNKRAKSAYSNQYSSALEIINDTCYDKVSEIKSPVLVAWNGIVLINKIIPYTSNMIDKKTKLYNAYLCSMIQFIANDLLKNTYSDIYYSNFYSESPSDQQEKYETLKYNLILQLKSTLTTREYLIDSGFLDESYAKEMAELNKETAELLNKTENCCITGLGDFYDTEYSADYSWIADFKSKEKADYSVVIDQYKEAISNDFYRDYFDGISSDADIGEYLNSELLSAARSYNSFNVYYASRDVNNDGVDELFIGAKGNNEDVRCYDVFVYDNGKVSRPFKDREFGYRTNFKLLNNNVFEITASGSSETSGIEYYNILYDNSTKLLNSLLYDYGKYYTVDGESKNNITENKFNEIKDSYRNSGYCKFNWKKITSDYNGKDFKSDLLNYYWTNSIQSPFVYEFKSNGTFLEYSGFPENPSDWVLSDEGKYTCNKNGITLYFKGQSGSYDYKYNLKYVSFNSNINWDSGLHLEEKINSNEYFFYQTDFDDTLNPNGPSGNAFYLQKSSKIDSNKENSGNNIYNEYKEALVSYQKELKKDDTKYYAQSPEYFLYDMNKDGTKELIINSAKSMALCQFYFYTYNGKAKLLGKIVDTRIFAAIPNDENGLLLYIYAPPNDGYSLYIDRITIKNNKLNRTHIVDKQVDYDNKDKYISEYYDPTYTIPTYDITDYSGLNDLKS